MLKGEVVSMAELWSARGTVHRLRDQRGLNKHDPRLPVADPVRSSFHLIRNLLQHAHL